MKKLQILLLALLLPLGCKTKQQQAPAGPATMKPSSAQKDGPRSAPTATSKGTTSKGTVSPPKRTGPFPPAKIVDKKDPRAIVNACIKRKGGLKRILSVKTARATHVVKSPLDPPPKRVTLQFPDKIKVESLSTDEYAHIMILDGDKGYYKMRGKPIKKLAKHQRKFLSEALNADPLPVLQAVAKAGAKAGAKLTYKGETRLGERVVDVVTAHATGVPVDLFVARDDGELLAYRHRSGMGLVTVVHSDFKQINGVRIAHTNTIHIGQGSVVAKITKIELDPKLDPHTFDPNKHVFVPTR